MMEITPLVNTVFTVWGVAVAVREAWPTIVWPEAIVPVAAPMPKFITGYHGTKDNVVLKFPEPADVTAPTAVIVAVAVVSPVKFIPET